MSTKRILISANFFPPAYKAGGPVKTVEGLSEALSHSFDLYIVAEACDLGDKETLPGIEVNKWIVKNNTHVFYGLGKEYWFNILKSTDLNFDSIYFNSLFSFKYTIGPLLYWKMRDIFRKQKSAGTYIIAPRGQLSGSALQIRSLKKRVVLYLLGGVLRKLQFHATSEIEYEDIAQKLGIPTNNITLIPNLRSISEFRQIKFDLIAKGELNTLKLTTITRIVPIKNIDFSIEVLSQLPPYVNVTYDIYGIVEDEDYWKRCLEKISKLTPNITVNYMGGISAKDVIPTIKKYHLLFHPSQSENFGHTILESLMAGRPVLISDQTFWKDLEHKKAGWDLALKADNFVAVLLQIASMDDAAFRSLQTGAYELAKAYFENNENIEKYKKMFKI